MRGSLETADRRALPHTPAVDGRKRLARKIRTVMREIIDDNGGVGQLSETKLQLSSVSQQHQFSRKRWRRTFAMVFRST
jgi:hypothetical protein